MIEKLPSEVFGFVATHDFENRPKRDPSVVEMTPTATGPIGEGATARLVRKMSAADAWTAA